MLEQSTESGNGQAAFSPLPIELETGLPSTLPPPRLTIDSDRSPYDNETRRGVVAAYLQYGKAQRVTEVTGVPRETIRDWLRAEWWDDVAADVRQQVEHSTRAKIQAIVTEGLDTTLDRLQNGETLVIKGLGPTLVPVKARDAALITAMMYDKLRLSLNLPSRIADNQKVDALADQLAKLSNQVNAKTVSEQ